MRIAKGRIARNNLVALSVLLRGSIRHASTIVTRTPLEEYNAEVKNGKLIEDPYQRKIITSLLALHTKLETYDPPPVPTPTTGSVDVEKGIMGTFRAFFGSSKKKNAGLPPESDIKGIYLYGDVGCGKTMLMDLFFSKVPPHLTKKRIHFHQFMQHLHKRSHELKVQHDHEELDVIPFLAAEIANESRVLCFDELQVTDVADAMLLRRLLLTILSPDYGVVLFATSNRAPDDLYLNGIQRASFIPCIQYIKKQTRVIYLNSPTDYRKVPKPMTSVYYFPKPGVKYLSSSNQAKCRHHVKQWYDYFNGQNENKDIIVNYTLEVWGRKLTVPLSSPPYVAQFTFEELCGRPLAAGDYLTLAHSFQSFIITDIPYLTIDVRDNVRRFITFLDAVYDAHGRIATTSATDFKNLFVEPENLKKDNFLLYKKQELLGKEETFANDDLVVKHGFDKEIARKASMFVNDEERFAFARALSRLSQMSTTVWVENPRHL